MTEFDRDRTPKLDSASLADQDVLSSSGTSSPSEVHAPSETILNELSVERYRSLAENATQIVWETDLVGNFTWVSPSVEIVLGWRPQELTASSEDELCSDDDLELLLQMRSRVARGERFDGFEIRYLTKAGEIRTLISHRASLADERGTVTRVVSGLSDITETVISRSRMAESESRLRQIAEYSSDFVLLIDVDDTIEWVSSSATILLGWTVEQLLGTSSWDLLHPDDREKVEHAHRFPHHGTSVAGAVRIRTATGGYRWMSTRSRVTRDARGVPTGRVIAQRDVEQEVGNFAQLTASVERYRFLAENANGIVYEIDRDGIIQWISPSVQRELGFQPEDLIGRPSITMIYPDDVQKVVARRHMNFDRRPHSLLEVRYMDTDGKVHWMSVRDHLLKSAGGETLHGVIGLTNIDDEVAARDALALSEGRYRLLAENSNDVVLECDERGIITWASPSVFQVLGYQVEEISNMSFLNLIDGAQRNKVSVWWALVALGERVESREARLRLSTDDYLWMELRAHLVNLEGGNESNIIVTLRNIEAEVSIRRANAALSSGSRAMIHSTRESDLLNRMCQVAVDDGGYALAWYGRKMSDDQRSMGIVARSRGDTDYLDDLQVSWSDVPLGRGPTGTAARTGQVIVANDLRYEAGYSPWLSRALENGLYASIALPVTIEGVVDGVLTVYASESNSFDSFAVSVLEDLATAIGHGISKIRNEVKLVDALRDHQLLSSVIEQAGDAIVVSDQNSKIIYVNPAATRSSGYSSEELVGQNPRIFQSGLQSRAFYERMWVSLGAGKPWRGVLTNRRKDGDIFEEDTTISPIFDADGALMAYVAVKHDLTSERRLEAELQRETSDRDAVVDIMREIRPLMTLDATADAFCEAATRLEGVDAAALGRVSHRREFVSVANRGPLSLSTFLDGLNVQQLTEYGFDLMGGPVQITRNSQTGSPGLTFASELFSSGIHGIVLAPIRWEGELIGVLVLATRSEESSKQATSGFAYFEELATYAGSLIGAQAMVDLHDDALRNEIQDIIDNRRFHPVFQPFINLETNAVVGYEALTRFDDGLRPDLRFIDAHEVGLGSALEAVCVQAAFDAAKDLDHGLFLSVNFSPTALLDGQAVRTLAESGLNVVIELTEHAPIGDYAMVRRALDEIPHCRVAVDDAGAGYTSLRHILELRPDFVKLDVSIVRHIDTDPARQAMAAAMCHFATHDGTIIIAEGVESLAEAETLRSIAAPLGTKGILAQGFIFAAPAPFESL